MFQLKPLDPSDVKYFYQWLNDDEAIQYSLSLFQKISSEKEINNWFVNSVLIKEEKTLNLGIYLDNGNKLIGYTGLCNISKENKSGEYFIFIGDKNMWGRGIGTLITKQILKIGFKNFNLNRIYLTVSELNTAALKAYQKAGFVDEGRLREANFRKGKFHDKIIMSVLKSEWKVKN